MRAVNASSDPYLLRPLFFAALSAVSGLGVGCTKDPEAVPTRPRDAATTDMPATDMPMVATCASAAQCDYGHVCVIGNEPAVHTHSMTTRNATMTTRRHERRMPTQRVDG